MQTMDDIKAEIAAMPMDALKKFDQAQETNIKYAQSLRQAVQEEVLRRKEPDIAAAYEAAGKQHGNIKVTLDGVEVEAAVSKAVRWDQQALEKLASEMPLAEAQHYFDISFKVPEAKFKAMPPSDLKAQMEEARTVKYGEPKVKFGGGE